MIEGYITLQEAADLLGVSRQTVTRRAAGQSMDSNLDSLDSNLDSKPASIVQGKKRYILKAWALAEQKANGPMDSPGRSMDSKLDSMDSPRTDLDSNLDSMDGPRKGLDSRILDLEKDLLAAQVEAAALRATVKAQEAHIDSLQRALDAEKAIHMASLQKRLTAPGRGFMDWIRGRGKKQNDR